MLCSLAAVIGEEEADAVKFGGGEETEWRHGQWYFPSLAVPLSVIGVRVVGGESDCGEPRTSSRQHPHLFILRSVTGPTNHLGLGTSNQGV
jgi:hypothetical protein